MILNFLLGIIAHIVELVTRPATWLPVPPDLSAVIWGEWSPWRILYSWLWPFGLEWMVPITLVMLLLPWLLAAYRKLTSVKVAGTGMG